MVLTPRLEQRQSQNLVMTPQLQQAIKLLQLTNVELSVFVEQEIQQNPLLEREDGEGPAGANDHADRTDADPEAVRGVDVATAEGGSVETSKALDVDEAWDGDGSAAGAGTYGHSAGGGGGASARGFDGSPPNLEETLSRAPTLRDHMTSQLGLELRDPVDRMIGVHLMDMLDEAGYVTGDLAHVARLLGCGLDRVEAALARVQRFDPPGIFARTLAECLAIQLRDRNRLDPAMQALLDNLHLLAKRDYGALEAVTGVDGDDLMEMVAEINALDPKPALVLDNEITQAVVPDILMRAAPSGGWLVELNNDTLPRVLVNNQYLAHLKGAVRRKEDRKYLSECLQSANWLVKSLHQRATTILKVATEIVRQQEMFFIGGVQHLRPLVLKDIAEAIDMHESTVSRVTSNKYISTPRGIYELKYFFTQALGSLAGGEAHSAESVRHRIKALIHAEPADKVLSDGSLVATLQGEGVDIARRTVAKYRQSMGISSSVQRRREKMSLARMG
jgi:RNA polymerase sigma-54 factor